MNALRRPSTVLALLVLGNSFLHFVLGWVLGLTGDEAHYALYASHLALSYYDHPPLVGWIQWPLVALGAPVGLLRLIPETLWAIGALLVYDTARRLHTLLVPASGTAEGAGLWAVAAYTLAPLLHLIGIGLVPDTLLMTLTAAIMRQTLRLLDEDVADHLSAWLLLGLWLGLAGLSKYTAIFAAFPVMACLFTAYGAVLLKRAGPWLALALAIALVVPVFLWNAQHQWISFTYQLHHGSGGSWQLSAVLIFLLAQLLLYPVFVRGLWGLRTAVRGGFPLDSAQRWLLAFFALPFGVLTYLAGGGTSLPHWTAPAWVALAPFAGLGLAALWAHEKRWLITVGLSMQVLLTLIFYVLMLWGGAPGMAGVPIDSEESEAQNPFTDFYGWDQVGARARELAQQNGIAHLAVQNWTLASRFAWYARPLPVHVLAPDFDQFTLWSGPLPEGANAVVMDWSQMAYRLPVGEGQFERCTLADTVPVERAGRMISHFHLYLCENWGGVPIPRRSDEP
jgi:4-amino-4-deoxy-L-arabinose transferase-like glycosyltransferase